MYPDGSSVNHPTMGRVGGYGVFFGDERDVAEPPPLDEEHTNNRVELRAVLVALQRQVRGTMSSSYVVDEMFGPAHKWRRHKWQTQLGQMQHVDLWAQMLQLLDAVGPEV